MAFGPKMSLSIGELTIEMAPLTKEVMGEFVAGMQQYSVNKYLGHHWAPTLEDELEWFDKTRAAKDSLVWGIWVVKGDERILIGNTALTDIEKKHIHQATSGSMIFRKEYWGKGIASHIHKARTWYAFQHLGLHRVRSAVAHGNIASLKALEKSGYNRVYVERNTQYIDGELRHQDNLECLNSLDSFWADWWHSERPTAQALAARNLTREALKWAKDNVNLD
jgi:RimJ/RimL family protein N-acetyltransferase